MKMIDRDLSEYLDLSQITSGLNSAFSKPSADKKAGLDPILEEKNALVEYKPNETLAEQRMRKNKELKKQVLMLTSEVKGVDEKTFVTGGGMAGDEFKEEEDARSWKPTKHYKYEEDELLDEVAQHEKDMNEMLKYLSEVEDLVHGGQDLKEIESMMGATKDNLDYHLNAYENLRGSINDINQKAAKAIDKLSFYEKTKTATQKLATLARIEEDEESHE